MIVITREPSSPPPEPPVATDDHPFRYELTYDGDHRRAYAATLTELCATLIEGYDPAEISERLQAEGVPSEQLEDLVTGELDELRIVHAVTVQVRLQADLNARAHLDDLTQHQLGVLRGNRVTQPSVDSWDATVPLVLSPTTTNPMATCPSPKETSSGSIPETNPPSSNRSMRPEWSASPSTSDPNQGRLAPIA